MGTASPCARSYCTLKFFKGLKQFEWYFGSAQSQGQICCKSCGVVNIRCPVPFEFAQTENVTNLLCPDWSGTVSKAPSTRQNRSRFVQIGAEAPRQAIDEIFVLFCLQRRSAFRPHVPITYRQTVLNGVTDSILIYKEEHPSAMVSDRDSRHDPPNAFNMRACNSSSSPTMFATTVTGEKYILRTVCTKSCKPCAHARIENVRMNLLSI